MHCARQTQHVAAKHTARETVIEIRDAQLLLGRRRRIAGTEASPDATPTRAARLPPFDGALRTTRPN